MDVALHRRQHDLAARRRVGLRHELFQVADARLHGLGRLQHLGHDQLVIVEQPTHFRHPRHQRPVDDIQRRGPFAPLRIQIRNQAVFRAFHDVVGQPLIQRQIGGLLFHPLRGPAEMVAHGRDVILIHRDLLFAALLAPVLRHSLQDLVVRMIGRHVGGRGIEQQVFRQPPLFHRDRREALQAFGIHDRQVQASLRAVIQEDRVHHFARRSGQAE